MKIRSGFVSNSSSSSFTMIVSEDDHKRIMEAMDADAREYVRFFTAAGHIGNQKVIAFQYNSGDAFYDEYGYPGFYVEGTANPDVPTKLERKKEYFFDYFDGARSNYMDLAKKLEIKRVEVDISC